MPRPGLSREGGIGEEISVRPQRSRDRRAEARDTKRALSTADTDALRLAHSHSSGQGFSTRRAELLTEMQRSHGNAYVNEFIGHEIIAARGHNSPPATGPGSHGEPLKKGGKVLSVAAMKKDAYHASSINAQNPVVVWSDGTNLFFAPSQEQVTRGRTLPAPEPVFVPMPGYKAEELHWDRYEGLTSGGGPLVVIARKTGVDDIDVAISNTLEQVSNFAGASGLASGGKSHITREGAQFLATDETTVPLALSGGTSPGQINSEVFPDGFIRYRAPGGNQDLYVSRSANPPVHLVEQGNGNIAQSFSNVEAVVPEPNGIVRIETTATGAGAKETTSIDLRLSPPTILRSSGHVSAEAPYADAKKRLVKLGVDIKETGVRFKVTELRAIEEALTVDSAWGLTALQEFGRLEKSLPTILEVDKKIGPDAAFGHATAGGGTPLLLVREPFEASSTARVSTIRHEITHVIMGALDVVRASKLTRSERSDLEGSLRFEARQALKLAKSGLIRSGEIGPGDVKPGPGTMADWRGRIGHDPELANVWIELLRRYSFIPDPEGTGELRGVSLADESRYAGLSETAVGHPTTSVDEFVASFVACAKVFRSAFIADVVAAQTAGDARGGGGGTYLRGLYKKAWDLISAKYVPLGANPF